MMKNHSFSTRIDGTNKGVSKALGTPEFLMMMCVEEKVFV